MANPASGQRDGAQTPPPAAVMHRQYAADEQDVAEILRTLWSQKFIIVFVTFVWIGLGFAYVSFKKPQFTSSTSLIIERQTSPLSMSLSPSALLGGSPSSGFINSEVEILRSPELLYAVLTNLNMTRDPEFAPDPVRYPGLTEMQHNLLLIEEFSRAVTVRPVAGSSIVKIEVRSESPVKAAQIANALANTYIEHSMEKKFAEAEKLSGWLDSKKRDLEDRLQKDVTALQDYQAKTGMLGSNILTFQNQEYLQLNNQLLEAEKLATAANARLQQTREQASRPGGLFSLEDVMRSPVINSLKNLEAQRAATLADMQTKYGAKHPERQRAAAELEKIQTQILKEIRTIIESVEGQVKTAEANVEAIRARITALQTDYRDNRNAKLIKLQDLEMKVEASKKLYESFLNIYQTTSPHRDMQRPDAAIVSAAQPPVRPTYPNKALVLVLSTLVGGFMGVFLALVLDRFKSGFRHVPEIEGFTGFPLYGVIPEAKAVNADRPVRYVTDRPASTLAESVRALRMNIALRAYEDEDIRTITITSTRPGEGKSTLSAWLAIAAAKAGERVLLIDCDLRRPRLHKYFGLTQGKTLVDFLTDRATMAEIVQKDEATGLSVITSKSTPTHALALLTSPRMETLLDDVRDNYDLVILDAPAAAALSDPFILTKLSDRTLFVYEWANTKRDDLASTIGKFYDIHCESLGIVVNKVDLKKAGLNARANLSYAYVPDDLKD